MAYLVLTDSSQLTAKSFEKLLDQIMGRDSERSTRETTRRAFTGRPSQTMAPRRLLLASLILSSVTTQSLFNTTWWPCSTVRPQLDVNLTQYRVVAHDDSVFYCAMSDDATVLQVLGLWYGLQYLSPVPLRSNSECRKYSFTLNSLSNLTWLATRQRVGQPLLHDDDVTVTIDNHLEEPYLWDLQGIPAIWYRNITAIWCANVASAAVVVFQDPSLLAVSVCQRPLEYDWTVVIGRQSSYQQEDLDRVNNQLRLAGVNHLEDALLANSTVCRLTEQH
uniref:Uncharacterized protein n=1 Tax=Timema cristinae TaxID=61476 RepID=A0A7R9CYQ2_TIMCR|nr:unnamed protein product [Timema cristinae]